MKELKVKLTGWWTVLTSRPYRASKALSPEPTTTDAGDCPLCKAGHSDKCEDHAYHKETA